MRVSDGIPGGAGARLRGRQSPGSGVQRADPHVHEAMKQCDKYVERGAQVLDANSENTDRCDTKKKDKTKKRHGTGLPLGSLLSGTVSVRDSINMTINITIKT